jgi:hypothetical protein
MILVSTSVTTHGLLTTSQAKIMPDLLLLSNTVATMLFNDNLQMNAENIKNGFENIEYK